MCPVGLEAPWWEPVRKRGVETATLVGCRAGRKCVCMYRTPRALYRRAEAGHRVPRQSYCYGVIS